MGRVSGGDSAVPGALTHPLSRSLNCLEGLPITVTSGLIVVPGATCGHAILRRATRPPQPAPARKPALHTAAGH